MEDKEVVEFNEEIHLEIDNQLSNKKCTGLIPMCPSGSRAVCDTSTGEYVCVAMA